MTGVRRPRPQAASERPTIAITGCSSGIGRATALQLASDGYHVLAGVRDRAVGDALAAAQPGIEPIRLDVTDEDDLTAFGERLDALPHGLAGLVNNAGIVHVGPIEGLPASRWREAMEVNVIGLLGVTRTALPAITTARGRVVNVSSPVSRIALPMLGPYAATKAAATALNDTLRRELAETGVRVIEVTPGAIATPIFDKGVADGVGLMQCGHPHFRERYGAMAHSAIEAGRQSGTDGAPPEVAAAAIVRALTARRPPAHIRLGVENRVVGILSRAVPTRLADAVLLRATRTRSWHRSDELQQHPDAAAYFAGEAEAIIAPLTPVAEALWSAATPRERYSVRGERRREHA